MAVEIAQRELNSICHAVGQLRVADTDELHCVPMKVTHGVEVEKDGRNVAKGYKPAAGDPPNAPAAAVGHADTTAKRGPWA